MKGLDHMTPCEAGSTLVPFSAAHIKAMKHNDTFTTEGMFLGISDKPVKWTVYGFSGTGVMLRASYFGILLGLYTAKVNKGKGVLHATV